MHLRPTLPLSGLALLATMAVAGCDAPDTGATRALSRDGPPPVILPLDEVLAQTDVPGLEPTDTADLQARAAALSARAGAIAATGTDPETRARLDAALAARGG
jgi:hypothetical protein